MACFNTSDDCDSDHTNSLGFFVLVVLFPIICVAFCCLFIVLCFKKKHQNRITSEQYPTIQQNDYDINSSAPPPYTWYYEPPPPPYSSQK